MYTLHTERFGQAALLISRHRTLSAAVKADAAFQRSQRRIFGSSFGWTPTVISLNGERAGYAALNSAREELSL